ncbi:MAG: 8-oxoguanine deaminase [Candidatus Tyrphobacter sp.]
MATLLLRNAALLATFDDADSFIEGGAVFARDGVIEAVGPSDRVPGEADDVVDASNMVVIPGLVCAHHHFYQTLTRNIPAAQDVELFDWLVAQYPIWEGLDARAIAASAAVALAELMLTGCTTAADHCYIWPNGARIDDEIAVAREMGFRLHASRGSMSIGEDGGGLPPQSVVEDEDAILADCARAADRYHDASRFSMTRIVVAPCSPFSVSPRLMRESALFARQRGLSLHTHLCETSSEERYCLERFGKRPVEFAESLEWYGDDVWFAHAIHMRPDEIERLGETRTGVAHCPTSNMRLGSGIAPLRAQMRAGMRVGLGVDGSASNDTGNMLDEARRAMLLQRMARAVLPDGGPMLTAREALRIATRGGAAVLGRDDIGVLAPNMAADFVGVRVDTLEKAGGAVHDALASLLFCGGGRVDLTVIAGRIVVRDQHLTGVDERALVREQNAIAKRLVST